MSSIFYFNLRPTGPRDSVPDSSESSPIYVIYAIHTHSSPDTLPYVNKRNENRDCEAQSKKEFEDERSKIVDEVN